MFLHYNKEGRSHTSKVYFTTSIMALGQYKLAPFTTFLSWLSNDDKWIGWRKYIHTFDYKILCFIFFQAFHTHFNCLTTIFQLVSTTIEGRRLLKYKTDYSLIYHSIIIYEHNMLRSHSYILKKHKISPLHTRCSNIQQ